MKIGINPKDFPLRSRNNEVPITKFHHPPYICPLLKKGGIAQLARALAWHARGHRFESDYLHLNNPEVIDFQQLRDFYFKLSPQ